MKTSIGFIGGGRITKIFLEGFKNKNVEFESVTVYEPNGETLNNLKKAYTEVEKAETPEEVMDLIPVKPIGENEEEIRNTLNTKLMGLFEKIKS